jgi:hypothetical protein
MLRSLCYINDNNIYNINYIKYFIILKINFIYFLNYKMSTLTQTWIAEYNGQKWTGTQSQVLKAFGEYLRKLSSEEGTRLRDKNEKLSLYKEGTDKNAPIEANY